PVEWWCSPVALGANPVPRGATFPPAASYLFDLIDMNGDGIADIVSASLSRGSFVLPLDGRPGFYCPPTDQRHATRLAYNVFLGDGHGHFSAAQLWVAPDWPVNCRDSEPVWNVLLDMNGDGLPDLVHEAEHVTGTTRGGSPIWAQSLYVAYNNGHGFEPAAVQILDNVGIFPFRFDVINECAEVYGSFLKDVDGDGLPDLACMAQSHCAIPGFAFGSGSAFHSPTTGGDPLQYVEWDWVDGIGFRHRDFVGRGAQLW